jgi:protein-S-isoprenylcysteine O-methyltransferase Ste14
MNASKRSSIMGDGPKLALYLLPALGAALAASLIWPGHFTFAGKYYGIAFAIGIELAAFGLVFQASSAFELIRAYRAGKLAIRGSFGLCRNPISAWWIFSVLPALALMMNSWLLIAVAILFRILSARLAKAEEAELGELFGAEYWRYKARVRPFLPLPYFQPLGLRRYFKAALILAALGLAAIAVFAAVAAPAMLRLGATRAEVLDDLPGDEYVGLEAKSYTQAIDVAAPPEELWKWLIQIGYKRAGW